MTQRYAGSPRTGRIAARTTGPTKTRTRTSFAGSHSGTRLSNAPIPTAAPHSSSCDAVSPNASGSSRTAFSGTSTRPRSVIARPAGCPRRLTDTGTETTPVPPIATGSTRRGSPSIIAAAPVASPSSRFVSARVGGLPVAPMCGSAWRLNRTNAIVQANRTASTATSARNHSVVTRSVAGSAYAARHSGPISTSRRSTPPSTQASIWRQVTSTPASRPDRQPGAVVPVVGALADPRVEAAVLQDREHPAAGRPGLGTPDRVPGQRDPDHRGVEGGDELGEDAHEEDAQDRERRRDHEPRGHRPGGVRRLAAGGAGHDQVAQGEAAHREQRDRDQEHRPVQVRGRLVAEGIEGREEPAPEVLERGPVRVAHPIRVPDREIADRVTDERDVPPRERLGRGHRRGWRGGCPGRRQHPAHDRETEPRDGQAEQRDGGPGTSGAGSGRRRRACGG